MENLLTNLKTKEKIAEKRKTTEETESKPSDPNLLKKLNQQENIWKNGKLLGNGFYMTRTEGCGVVYVMPASIKLNTL
jgi:hypothetical protein